MKVSVKHLLVTALIASSASMVYASGNTIEHRFFKAGFKSGGPGVFDAKMNQVWGVKDENELSDGWHLPDGGSIYSYSIRKQHLAGAIRLDPNQKELWRYECAPGTDNHSCQPLPHGGFLLGETSKTGVWFVEIDADGKEIKRLKVGDKTGDIHHTFRMVRKTKNNTYLASVLRTFSLGDQKFEGNKSHEWDENGKLIHTFPSGFFLATRLSNGNTLVSEGHGRGKDHVMVTEYAPDNSIVWELTDADLKKANLAVYMVCGLHRLPNGNTIVTNVKHGKSTKGNANGKFVKAFEVTPDKKVVWSIPNSVNKKNMCSIQILDIEGDVHNYGVMR